MSSSIDSHISGRFKIAIALTAVTLIAEIVGGIWTNSLALLSDAAHVFLDLFALLLSLGAITLAALPASDTRTFGYHRTEVFASFINGVTIFLIAIGIFFEAGGRILHPETVNSLPMLIIAIIGLVMNLVAAKALHSHSHDDLNVRSAFLHVVGDAAASVGVIVGGIIMYYSNWYLVDAIISIGIGCVVFFGSWRVLKESVHILMEGTPRGVKLAEVAATIRGVDGVRDVHHLNIWTVCSHILALSAHIDIDPDYDKHAAGIVHKIEHLLLDRYHISHTTLQMECSACKFGPVIKEFRHISNHSHSNCNH